jgi:transposase
VHERLLTSLKCSAKLFAVETTAPVLDPGRGKTKAGQLWAYARDDRPWGGADRPGVAYVYAPDRKAERPIAHLAGFAGTHQVDGYAGYRALAERGDVQLAFCWAHLRRRFYELAAAGPAPIASEALERIAFLYAIEREILATAPRKGATPGSREAGRSSMNSSLGSAPSSLRSVRRQNSLKRSATRYRVGRA